MQSIHRQFDLAGKVAIVTGGSKGLGKSMSEALASAGADVVLTSRHANEAMDVAKQITEQTERRCLGVESDVTSEGGCGELVERVAREFGRIDILINNAGINIRGAIDELNFEQFREVQRINVDGLWLMSRAIVPYMKKAESGRIINMASTLGLVGLDNRTPYATSKGAVVQMTRALALELAPFKVCVNAICPGPFLTPMNQKIAEDEHTKKFIVGAVALGRWGEMHEIQGAAVFLASDASSYVTGAMIPVDGGWTAR